MKSVMTHQFSQVPDAQIPRSSFDRSHGHKTTFDAGYLVPIYVDEALPGDTFNLRATGFTRMATPIHPLMDNLFVDTFFFAVPNRLLWDNWQKFNGEQDNPADSTDFLVPTLFIGANTGTGSIHDYMGVPNGVSPLNVNALHYRAYNLIFNEWFRDQNLQNSVTVNTDDGPDATGDYTLLRRGKRHDYFTSCLPWPQKGEAVLLPLGDLAPIQGIGVVQGQTLPVTNTNVTETGGGADTYVNAAISANIANMMAFEGENSGGDPSIYADLSAATAATINDLRLAFQTQKLLERDARGGTRYTEIIRAHFGVTSPDARLQRPEYLGGGSTPINVQQVAQTSETTTTPQGNLAAYATAQIHGNGFAKSFTEHCVIIGLASVRADLTYQQGIERMWHRQTRYDYYWPALAHIGEQAVLNEEIYAKGDANDQLVFGYQERYAEYRYKPSRISGDFRSTATASLDAWHLAQEFTTLPVLGATFIEENPPVDRVIAVPAEPHFITDFYFDIKCARPMPLYGVPGMIDHF